MVGALRGIGAQEWWGLRREQQRSLFHDVFEEDLGDEGVGRFTVALAKEVQAEDERQQAGEQDAGLEDRRSDQRVVDPLTGNLAPFLFEGIPLLADGGTFGLQVAVEFSELAAGLGVGFDKLPAAFGNFSLQFRHPAVLFGLPFGGLFGEAGEAFVSITAGQA